MKNEFVAIYITASNQKEARKIGKMLVEERLAGCVNIIPKIESFYWQKGALEKSNESVVIAKTRRNLVNKVITFVKKHHSYSVPCINAFPILEGNPNYLEWLDKETKR